MEKGVPNIAALQGGWAAWQRAGYPVEGATVAAITSAEEMPMLGKADAPVTILEFSDYQCPYCRQYVQHTLPKIMATYVDTGQVRYLFKDFPLESHANAHVAAEAARCAGSQGAYWAMHGQLFDAQQEWAWQGQEDVLESFVRYAEDLGLDGTAFRECLQSGQFGEQVRQDQWEGQQAGVHGTPSFLINGQLLAGAYPFETFQQMIEAELQGSP
jgi:protein-disulfide isomerase